MSMETFDDDASRQALSALADGELAGIEGGAACVTWHRDPAARQDWHAWHLIGDVLRSEELASDPGADLKFCVALRTRLATEPVVLAPAARRAPGVASARDGRTRSTRWMFGSAAAAGFVLVAGTFAVLRPVDTPAPAPLARADEGAAPAVVRLATSASAVVADAAPRDVVIADQRLIRDAQLDRYLVAHKQFAGTSALGVPSVFLRSATVDSASR